MFRPSGLRVVRSFSLSFSCLLLVRLHQLGSRCVCGCCSRRLRGGHRLRCRRPAALDVALVCAISSHSHGWSARVLASCPPSRPLTSASPRALPGEPAASGQVRSSSDASRSSRSWARSALSSDHAPRILAGSSAVALGSGQCIPPCAGDSGAPAPARRTSLIARRAFPPS